MSEDKKNEREEMVKSKFAEMQKIVFSSGLTIGEIANIIASIQAQLNSLSINMNLVPPPAEEKVEEKPVEEVKE